MNIIKPGTLPKEKVHRHTCRTCRCVFEFNEDESSFKSFPRNESALQGKCPQKGCGAEFYHELPCDGLCTKSVEERRRLRGLSTR